MRIRTEDGSPRASVITIAAILGMLVFPACLTLHTVRVPAVVDVSFPNPSPFGYTVSLLLFVVPILVIGLWLVPRDNVEISKKSFVRTIALLFPLGVILDFFFAQFFLRFPNAGATLHIPAPALGNPSSGQIFIGTPVHVIVGSVPIEEYVFYLTGFVTVLLIYIWLDEYWLAAYNIPADNPQRSDFKRLLQFHPASLIWAAVLITAAILYRHHLHLNPPGFPGYFVFLSLIALGPSTVLFPSAVRVINWRAFSLTMFMILLTSLLWEATLGVPYGWWGYQPDEMMGLSITAWNHLPIEAVCVWVAVTYETIVTYEVVKRWQASGRKAHHAFLG